MGVAEDLRPSSRFSWSSHLPSASGDFAAKKAQVLCQLLSFLTFSKHEAPPTKYGFAAQDRDRAGHPI